MLRIVIPSIELFDDVTQEFIQSKEVELRLEHSLVSLSKWESKWQKPFLTKSNKTDEETLDYIRCMTITQNVSQETYQLIGKSIMDQIVDYIDDPMTATILPNTQGKSNQEIITSELVYYWMISFNIPFECQTWHLNRLLTLIGVCNVKNQPKKKTSQKDLAARNRALNETRKAKYNTSG